MKTPSFQFYPGDWLRDPALRSVSLAARGIWIDLLCLMHESPRRGYLIFPDGSGMKFEHLGRIFSVDKRTLKNLINELESCGVFSRDGDVIYSRRMVRDQQLSEKRKAAGGLGGNPFLVKQREAIVDSQLERQIPTPSSSSSSSSSILNPLPHPSAALPLELVSPPTPASTPKQRDRTPLTKTQQAWFESWWSEVWKKVSRGAAERAFAVMVRDQDTASKVIEATKAQTPALRSRELKYQPHPSTWLNEKRWLDEDFEPQQPRRQEFCQVCDGAGLVAGPNAQPPGPAMSMQELDAYLAARVRCDACDGSGRRRISA